MASRLQDEKTTELVAQFRLRRAEFTEIGYLSHGSWPLLTRMDGLTLAIQIFSTVYDHAYQDIQMDASITYLLW